jgi:hypothetical protein
MHLIPREAHGSGAAGVGLYAERYPQRRLPNSRMFHAIDRPIKGAGTVRPSTVNRRRQRSPQTGVLEECVMRRVQENARIGVR